MEVRKGVTVNSVFEVVSHVLNTEATEGMSCV